MLSVRNCRTSRDRRAPSARRSPISFCRAVARASRRFATLAQAMSRTSPTIDMSTTSGSANRPRRVDAPLAPDVTVIRWSIRSRRLPGRRSCPSGRPRYWRKATSTFAWSEASWPQAPSRPDNVQPHHLLGECRVVAEPEPPGLELRLHRHRDEDGGRVADHLALEPRRQHADDRERLPVQFDGPAYHAGVPVEPRPPEIVAEHATGPVPEPESSAGVNVRPSAGATPSTVK